MHRAILMIACLAPFLAGCVIKQAETDELKAEKQVLEEQQQIDKVEQQIKDLKEATDY